jgi:hypothetical protein
VLNSGGDGLPRELAKQRRGVIPRCVRVVARPCGVRALNARTCVREQVCAGAWERRAWVPSSDADRPRGCSTLERGRPRSRGGAKPSSEADPSRGGVRASSEADLTRGSVYPSSEADFTRGASAVLSWRVAGATRVVVVLCMWFRCAS